MEKEWKREQNKKKMSIQSEKKKTENIKQQNDITKQWIDICVAVKRKTENLKGTRQAHFPSRIDCTHTRNGGKYAPYSYSLFV